MANFQNYTIKITYIEKKKLNTLLKSKLSSLNGNSDFHESNNKIVENSKYRENCMCFTYVFQHKFKAKQTKNVDALARHGICVFRSKTSEHMNKILIIEPCQIRSGWSSLDRFYVLILNSGQQFLLSFLWVLLQFNLIFFFFLIQYRVDEIFSKNVSDFIFN